MKTASVFLTLCGLLAAQSPQAPNPVQQSVSNGNNGAPMPIYRVTVVARTTKAINYNHRSEATHIGFHGTSLMPEVRGEGRLTAEIGQASSRACH